MSTKLFQKRVDADLLENVSKIYESLGTSVQEAFVMFLRKSEQVKGLPFALQDETKFDENGILITQERLEQAKRYLAANAKKRAIRLDDSNPEHEAMLFDEEW